MTPDQMRATLALHGYMAMRGLQWVAVQSNTHQVAMDTAHNLPAINHIISPSIGLNDMRNILGVEMRCLSDDEVQALFEYIEVCNLWT